MAAKLPGHPIPHSSELPAAIFAEDSPSVAITSTGQARITLPDGRQFNLTRLRGADGQWIQASTLAKEQLLELAQRCADYLHSIAPSQIPSTRTFVVTIPSQPTPASRRISEVATREFLPPSEEEIPSSQAPIVQGLGVQGQPEKTKMAEMYEQISLCENWLKIPRYIPQEILETLQENLNIMRSQIYFVVENNPLDQKTRDELINIDLYIQQQLQPKLELEQKNRRENQPVFTPLSEKEQKEEESPSPPVFVPLPVIPTLGPEAIRQGQDERIDTFLKQAKKFSNESQALLQEPIHMSLEEHWQGYQDLSKVITDLERIANNTDIGPQKEKEVREIIKDTALVQYNLKEAYFARQRANAPRPAPAAPSPSPSSLPSSAPSPASPPSSPLPSSAPPLSSPSPPQREATAVSVPTPTPSSERRSPLRPLNSSETFRGVSHSLPEYQRRFTESSNLIINQTPLSAKQWAEKEENIKKLDNEISKSIEQLRTIDKSSLHPSQSQRLATLMTQLQRMLLKTRVLIAQLQQGKERARNGPYAFPGEETTQYMQKVANISVGRAQRRARPS